MTQSEPSMSKNDGHRAGAAALLLIDMMNGFDFPGGDGLKAKAEKLVEPILHLMSQARQAHVPIIFVNDNFGHWHADRARLVDDAQRQADSQRLQRLRPGATDYFVVKPQFSGFYATNLPVLLPKLGVSRLVLTGVATDICVLFTAADAHMRDYDIWVPQDCVASESDERGSWALEIMAQAMEAETAGSAAISLAEWLKRPSATRPPL